MGLTADFAHGRISATDWRERNDMPDPAANTTGAAPNWGKPVLPHILTYQGIVSSPFRTYRPSDEALRHSLENARFMRNDPVIMECLESRQRSGALLNWHLEPEDAKNAEQVELCAKLTDIIKQIPRFTEYRFNLLHAVWYGRYGIAHKWGWKRVGNRLRLVPVEWKPINGDKLVFRYDDGRGLEGPDESLPGIRVGTSYANSTVSGRWVVEPIGEKIVPTDHGLAYFLDRNERTLIAIHRHMIEDGAYEDPWSAGSIHGVGIRSRIYWTWFQKQECLAQMIEYLERSANGIELWFYPYGNSEAEAATRKAAEERIGGQRNIVMVPRPLGQDGDAYDVRIIEPGLAGVDALKDVIVEMFSHQIKRYILGQTLTSEATSTGLGSGVADLHLDTYLQIIKYDAVNLEETITTELVTPIKEYNFPKAGRVNVRFIIDTESDDAQESMEAHRAGWEMGLKLKANDVYDIIGASAPDEDDEALEHPQFQQLGQMGGMPGEMPPGGEEGPPMGGEPGANGEANGAAPADGNMEYLFGQLAS